MGELAASLAHELNQPLTAILSNAQAAQRFLAANPADLGEVRDILRNAVNEKELKEPGLGTRIAARFAGLGLTEEIPEQRGQPARPAEFDG